jgi:hypothetical protein
MPQTPLTRAEIESAIKAVEDALKRGFAFGAVGRSPTVEAGRVLGISRKKIEHRLLVGQKLYGLGMHIPIKRNRGVSAAAKFRAQQEAKASIPLPTLPDFPDDDIPEAEIIDLMCRRYGKRAEHQAAKRWFKIEMPDDLPFAVMWWGDPHLDSAGTNWPTLREHAILAAEEAVYSVNVGDTLDNWPHGSRLMALYAHSDTSVETARKLARWFLKGAGIRWMLWLLGNHDTWPGHTPAEWLKEVGGRGIAFEEWGAQFILATPGGAEFKIWASHDFPGHSMWNSLHGPQRAAHMKEDADVYVCGHRHNWALHKEESASRGFVYSLVRARGYKFIDDHASRLGHHPQQYGASILTVFDPTTRRHYDFEHPEDGVIFLRALRAQRGA